MATNGRNATAGHVRDLGVGQPLEVMQHHDCALGERQRGQGPGDRFTGEVTFGLRGGPGTGIGDRIGEIGEIGAPATSDLIEGPPGDDLIEPGRERGVGLEPGEVLPRCYQGILGDVLSVMVVTAKPQRDAVGHRGMPLNQHLVRIEVAVPRPGYEIAVPDLLSRPHSSPAITLSSDAVPSGTARKGTRQTARSVPSPCRLSPATAEKKPEMMRRFARRSV